MLAAIIMPVSQRPLLTIIKEFNEEMA